VCADEGMTAIGDGSRWRTGCSRERPRCRARATRSGGVTTGEEQYRPRADRLSPKSDARVRVHLIGIDLEEATRKKRR